MTQTSHDHPDDSGPVEIELSSLKDEGSDVQLLSSSQNSAAEESSAAASSETTASFKSLLMKRPAFRLMWIGSMISLIGDSFNWVGLIVLVTRMSDSDIVVSAMFVSETLPSVFFSAVAGVVADRYSRSMVMIVANIVAAIAMCGLIVAAQINSLEMVFSCAIVLFVCQAFFIPAKNALMPTLISKDEIQLSNSLDGMSFSVLFALGAAGGGLFTAAFGVTMAFTVNAISFALSALCLFGVHRQINASDYVPINCATNEETTNEQTTDSDGVEGSAAVVAAERLSAYEMYASGMRYLWQHKDLLALASFKSIGNMSLGAVEVICVRLTKDEYAIHMFGSTDSSMSLGLMWSLVGVGCLVGCNLALLFDQANPVHLRQGVGHGYALSFVGAVLLLFSFHVSVFFIAVSVLFFGDSMVYVINQTALTQGSTDEFRGRVFSFVIAMRTLSYSIGSVVAGVLIDNSPLSTKTSFIPYMVLMACNILFIKCVYVPYCKKHMSSDSVDSEAEDHVKTRCADGNVAYAAVNVTSDDLDSSLETVPV